MWKRLAAAFDPVVQVPTTSSTQATRDAHGAMERTTASNFRLADAWPSHQHHSSTHLQHSAHKQHSTHLQHGAHVQHSAHGTYVPYPQVMQHPGTQAYVPYTRAAHPDWHSEDDDWDSAYSAAGMQHFDFNECDEGLPGGRMQHFDFDYCVPAEDGQYSAPQHRPSDPWERHRGTHQQQPCS